MTVQKNTSNQQIIGTVTSSKTSQEKLEAKARRILDALAAEVQLPYDTVLEGRITNDAYNNYGVFVFIRKGDAVYPGVPSTGLHVNYLWDTVGGKWVNMRNTGFDPEWEARDIKAALKEIQEAGK